ncbi:MAG: bifunctional phosphoglucose/phosphomannose isomerase [Actinobacteria bacterium]|nr:MAG: bifunctional phosphoglucose/phosphomannose isomerase [Actinomycetota bacterium]
MTVTARDLGDEAVGRVDAANQLADILDLPEHLRDALWRVSSADIGDWDSRNGLVVAGMGGSAIGGDLARVALGDHASRPIITARDYGLPGWTTPDTTVLCASYSGETEETLAAFDAAGALGARRVAVTTGGKLAELARAESVPVIPLPGGFQPRVAVAYMTVAALEVAAACGAGPRMASEIDVAAAHIDQLCAEWGPEADDGNIAKEVALALNGSVPVIAGAGLTAPVAYRWKTQINENAKLPAFAGELPELDHNEIVGWQGTAGLGSFAAVFLEDADQHPRIGDRIELTSELIAEHATTVIRATTRGQGAVERVMSLVLLGDLVSLYLAVLRGIDPTPVRVIDDLKARLAKR